MAQGLLCAWCDDGAFASTRLMVKAAKELAYMAWSHIDHYVCFNSYLHIHPTQG